MRVLVTGAAGFIGYHVSERLLARGDEVVGVDNLNDYYDPALKEARLARLRSLARFRFERLDLADRGATAALFQGGGFNRVVHLAAQAGVRYSLTNPQAYIDSNLVGFGNVLEGCRAATVDHLVYASSSSVYGLNRALPFSTRQNADHPVSLYGATKKANELMAHAYSHLYGLPTTGLRFFTVYGPWGRPDMAYFLFTRAILAGEPIRVFNRGDMERDFTYIDDIAEGVVRCVDRIARTDQNWIGDRPDAATSLAPWRVYNIGRSDPVPLTRFIRALETALGLEAKLEPMPMQPGDVLATAADVTDLSAEVGFEPRVSIEEGIGRFVQWYREYYGA